MGLLDRLRSTPPPAKQPRGASGRGHYDGFLALDELNPTLAGARGLAVFDEMWRTDPDIRRVGSMMINPILGATWSIDPPGGDDATEADQKAADLVRWWLFEFLRGGLHGHLSEALPIVVRSGFAPFEQLWSATDHDGRLVQVPRKLALRLPKTITRFNQDADGELVSITQQVPTAHGEVLLPADSLVYYRVGAEGDNWEGTSLLRPAYKPWWYKDQLERIDAIGQETANTGLPVCYPPDQAGLDDGVLDDIDAQLADVRAGELTFLRMPGPHASNAEPGRGWYFELVGLGGGSTSGGTSSIQESLKYHSDKIAAAFVAEFMRLGQSGEGARATADVQQDPFLAGVEALASVLEAQLNADLIPRIVGLNCDGVEEPPKLTMSLVDSTSLTELQTYVSGLITSGAMQADPELEDFLREKGDLPKANEEVRAKRAEAADAAREAAIDSAKNPEAKPGEQQAKPGQPRPDDQKATEPKRLSQAEREGMRDWERILSVDTLEHALDNVRASFEASCSTLVHQAAVAAAADSDAEPDAGPLEDAIVSELTDLYATGRQTVADELAAQMRSMSTVDGGIRLAQGDEDPGPLRARAQLAARSIVRRIVEAIGRRRVTGATDPALLQAAGETEGRAALRLEAQMHAAPAINLGRAQQADDQADLIAGSRYTSILDRRRCRTCAAADDDVLRPLTDPVRRRRIPPNPDCEGGDRCRCMEVFQLRTEAAADR